MTPTERGLFERIEPILDEWDTPPGTLSRIEKICAEHEQQFAAAREEVEGLKLVVKVLVRDIEIMHENIRQGRPAEITLGSLGRLEGAREALAAPLPEKNDHE